MTRVNKTVKNLKTVWQQLDDASGALYNALDNLSHMTDLTGKIQWQMETIDVAKIDIMKNEIEEMIKEKGSSLE